MADDCYLTSITPVTNVTAEPARAPAARDAAPARTAFVLAASACGGLVLAALAVLGLERTNDGIPATNVPVLPAPVPALATMMPVMAPVTAPVMNAMTPPGTGAAGPSVRAMASVQAARIHGARAATLQPKPRTVSAARRPSAGAAHSSPVQHSRKPSTQRPIPSKHTRVASSRER